jgi:hypothetical protein
MKNIFRILSAAGALLLSAVASESHAQATATASATAVIVTPISISKTADMHFGNLAVSASNLGDVTLAPAGTRIATGGVTLPAVTGSPAAASFTVSGEANYTYAISLPSSAIQLVHSTNSLLDMDAHTFVSSPATTGTLSATGTQTLNVGATLDVAAGQAAGTYTTGTNFAVTVNYN